MSTSTVGFGATHLLVAVPSCGKLTTVRWGINLASQQYPLNCAVDYASAEDGDEKEIGLARNCVVKVAQKMKCKYIWFVDDDVLPPNYAVQQLMFAMQQDKKAMVCGGIYYGKKYVPSPMVFEDDQSGSYVDWKPGEVFEVPGFIGTGCMLIKTEVFDHIEEPWFKTLDYPARITDDAYFCRLVKTAGFKVLGHGGVLCGHYDVRSRRTYWPPEPPTIKMPELIQG